MSDKKAFKLASQLPNQRADDLLACLEELLAAGCAVTFGVVSPATDERPEVRSVSIRHPDLGGDVEAHYAGSLSEQEARFFLDQVALLTRGAAVERETPPTVH